MTRSRATPYRHQASLFVSTITEVYTCTCNVHGRPFRLILRIIKEKKHVLPILHRYPSTNPFYFPTARSNITRGFGSLLCATDSLLPSRSTATRDESDQPPSRTRSCPFLLPTVCPLLSAR